MDHVKKLVLVDPAAMPTLYRPTPVDLKLSSLDKDVSDVLSSDLPDDEKAKRYIIALRRYRHFDSAPVQKTDPLKEIIKAVKPDSQIKAKRILKRIKPHIRWSEDGEIVTEDNELVPDSNLAELLNEATTKSSVDDVIGLPEFAETLKRSDTPAHFMSNDRLRRHMRTISRRSASTSRRSRKKKKHQTLVWEASE